MSLKGKTLFITGASRGIGLSIALRAAKDGANIVIAAKTAETHKHLPGTIYSAAKEIEAAGGQALPLVVDVRDEANVLDAVEQAANKFGGIDITVNNASAISSPELRLAPPRAQTATHANYVPRRRGHGIVADRSDSCRSRYSGPARHCDGVRPAGLGHQVSNDAPKG